MQFIDLQLISRALPPEWAEKAEQAFDAVKDLPAEERREAIKKKPEWQQLKDVFGDLLNNKCWYCESILKRSPTPIDHFRPKSNVKEAPDHGGYWWLAYEWRNYRFACTHCNTFGTEEARGKPGGKQDHFPVRDESRRASGPRARADVPDPLEYEDPILLDPLKAGDPGFLWFNGDGSIIPHPVLCSDEKGYLHRRAWESIQIYGLYQDELNERRGQHLDKIRDLLVKADGLLIKSKAGDPTAKIEFDTRIQELKDAMSLKAEYSRAVKCLLMAQRGTNPSAELALS